jgi:hypothetical protein
MAALRTWTCTIDSSSGKSNPSPASKADPRIYGKDSQDVLQDLLNWPLGILRVFQRFDSVPATTGSTTPSSSKPPASTTEDEEATAAAAQHLLASSDLPQLAAMQLARVAQYLSNKQHTRTACRNTTSSDGTPSSPRTNRSPRKPKGRSSTPPPASSSPHASTSIPSKRPAQQQPWTRAVPAHHTALLASLGLQDTEPVLQKQGMSNPMMNRLNSLLAGGAYDDALADVTLSLNVKPLFQQAAHYLCRWPKAHPVPAGSSAATAGPAGCSSHENPSASQVLGSTPSWLVPAMQACLQVAVLWPGNNASILHTCLDLCCSFAACIESTSAAGCSSSCSQGCINSSDSAASQPAAAKIAALLAQPVLHQLGLAVLHQDRADDPLFDVNSRMEGMVMAMTDCIDAGAGAVPTKCIDGYLEQQTKLNQDRTGRPSQLRSSLQHMYSNLLAAVIRAGV